MDKFARTVTHGLRNPLNVAQAGLEMVQQDSESEHFDSVERAQDRMEQLIGDVLTLARAGEGGTETDTVGLAAITEAC
jgi:signal transduction histidine kinase